MDAGSIVVYFKAQTAELVKGIEDSNRRLEGFKKGIEGLGAFAAFRAIAGELVTCVEAASEAEVNVRKLQAVVSSQADVSTFQALASELSHVTTFSDDAAMSALSLLGKFNLTDAQMGALLPKVADFAAFMGTDLPQAAEAAGKAVANGSGGLRGLGLAFTDAEKKAFDMASQQERTNILLDRMTKKFGGVAEAAAQTGAGAMQQFSNEVAELEETIGGLVTAPIGAFFGGLAEVVRGVSTAIGGMSDNTRSVLGVLGAVVVGFTAATAATLAWGAAVGFMGGMPAILGSIATAAGTVAATLGTVIAPIIAITSTVIMLEGMISRIRSGNFNMNESFIDGIKNNFKAGLDDIRSAFSSVFEAPKSNASELAVGLKNLDTTARQTAAAVAAIDFKSELQQQLGSTFDALNEAVAGMDFSKHLNASNTDGFVGADTTAADEAAALDIGNIVSEELKKPSASGSEGMSAAAIKARAAEVAQTVDDTDVALAGLKGGLSQLAGKLGSVGGVIQGAMASVAKGDVVGAVVGVGIEMLTRTKSFGKLMQGLEGIFTALSQVLEPIVAALLPFLDIVSMLLPVVVAMNYPLKALSAIVQAVGNTLKQVINFLGGFWNGAVETIASFVEKIPFVGDDIAGWIRDAKIDLSKQLNNEGGGIIPPPVDPTPALQGLGDAAQKTADQLKNVPEGFKIAAARFAAVIRGEGDVSPTAPSSAPATGGTTYRLPPMLSRDDLIAGRANTRPSALPTNITIQNLSVTSNDPSSTAGTLAAAAKRDTFLRTGQTASGETTRAFWGA